MHVGRCHGLAPWYLRLQLHTCISLRAAPSAQEKSGGSFPSSKREISTAQGRGIQSWNGV
jgi:hypothetical protein